MVISRFQRLKLPVCHGETPPWRIIACHIRKNLRLVFQIIDVFGHLLQRQGDIRRKGITKKMKIGILHINDPLSIGSLQVRLFAVPFVRYRPVAYFGPTGYLMHLKPDIGYMTLQDTKGFPDRISGDAAVQRKDLPADIIHFLSFGHYSSPDRFILPLYSKAFFYPALTAF